MFQSSAFIRALGELLAGDAHNCENNWHLLQDLAAGAF